jgi:hypothetical protein
LSITDSRLQNGHLQEIYFTSAKTKKKQMDQATVLKHIKLPDISEPSSTELSTFFAALDITGKRPVLLSLVPGYAEEKYKPKALDAKYPQVLTDLYDETYLSVSHSEMQTRADEIFKDLQVTA